MDIAIDECIQNGILADFLRDNKAEVQKVVLFEYDEERQLEMERRDARERAEERFGQLLSELFHDGRLEDAKRIATDKEFREHLYEEYGIL